MSMALMLKAPTSWYFQVLQICGTNWKTLITNAVMPRNLDQSSDTDDGIPKNFLMASVTTIEAAMKPMLKALSCFEMIQLGDSCCGGK
jgi:hypothetical protein